MEIVKRDISSKLKRLVKQYPIVSVTGPRQSGKTTLVKSCFPNKPYVSLEDPDVRIFAIDDPRSFLKQYEIGAIFDEVQNTPDLFSYVQTMVDRKNRNGLFILTGSQNFLLLEKISQTLAGRTAVLRLLPYSLNELSKVNKFPANVYQAIMKGGYPRLYQSRTDVHDWCGNYIQTYIERDVRTIQNIGNLQDFQRLLSLCANRVGQLINLTSLANDCSLSHNTVKSWISVLEASYIIFLLKPHFKNFNKRLVKTPKLYFYDTALVCYLLGIKDETEIINHYNRGALFENFILSEIVKYFCNKGEVPPVYFWRNKTGHEIDCLIDKGRELIPVEIKSGETVNNDFFRNIKYWHTLTKPQESYLIYGGGEDQKRSIANVLSWSNLNNLFARI